MGSQEKRQQDAGDGGKDARPRSVQDQIIQEVNNAALKEQKRHSDRKPVVEEGKKATENNSVGGGPAAPRSDKDQLLRMM